MRQSQATVVGGDFSRRVARAIKVQLFLAESSISRLVEDMPADTFGNPYSYRAVARKLAGTSRMTVDDLEAFAVALGTEPLALVAAAYTPDSASA